MKKLIKFILKVILSKKIRKEVLDYYYNPFSRRNIENLFPKTTLANKHIKNCKLLLNRNSLIAEFCKKAVVAEFGVAKGDFSKVILKKTHPLKLHLIDIWNSDRYSLQLLENIKKTFSPELQKQKIQIHQKLSIEAALDFPDNYFDWVYIDTDHSYDTTKQELLRISPKIKKNGIIAGHDYSMGNWEGNYRYGVIEAVHEFCVNFSWEFIYLTIDTTERQSFAIRKIK